MLWHIAVQFDIKVETLPLSGCLLRECIAN